MTVADYLADVACGCLTDYDGHGYPMIGPVVLSEDIEPGDPLPEGTTHILWFNR